MTTTIAGETDLRIADESKVEFFLDAYLYYTVRRVYTHILTAGKGGTSLLSFLSALCARVHFEVWRIIPSSFEPTCIFLEIERKDKKLKRDKNFRHRLSALYGVAFQVRCYRSKKTRQDKKTKTNGDCIKEIETNFFQE